MEEGNGEERGTARWLLVVAALIHQKQWGKSSVVFFLVGEGWVLFLKKKNFFCLDGVFKKFWQAFVFVVVVVTRKNRRANFLFSFLKNNFWFSKAFFFVFQKRKKTPAAEVGACCFLFDQRLDFWKTKWTVWRVEKKKRKNEFPESRTVLLLKKKFSPFLKMEKQSAEVKTVFVFWSGAKNEQAF